MCSWYDIAMLSSSVVHTLLINTGGLCGPRILQSGDIHITADPEGTVPSQDHTAQGKS